MTIQLREYQTLAIEASCASPWQRQLIVLSTGLGKTITGLALAKKLGGRFLWLAHTEELVVQPSKAMALVWPEVSRGIVKAEQNEYMRHGVFASIQSAQQERRSAQLCAQNFDFVVVDEAHHALSPGYRNLLEALGCFREGGPRLLGLTATPERGDNGGLDEVFQGVVFQMGITSAIAGGYLVAPRVVERSIKVDLDSVTVTRGDYGQKQLDIALMQAGIVREVCSAFEENCAGRKAIIFVVSVAQSESVAAELRARGHSVAAVSGETDREERRRILKKLHTGEVQCVVNCMVLTEGFDEPSVNAIILARPTQSKPLMIQMVGRGLRLYPGKTDCVVVDMVAASKRNTMVQAAVLFGARKEAEEKPKSIDVDPISDPEEYWRQRLQSQISGVKGAPQSKMRWLASHDGKGWVLTVGEYGTIRMMPAGDDWTLDVIGSRVGASRQVLAGDPVSMETAQALAEDYVRRAKQTTLALGGRWREDPATDAQISMLKRAGFKVDGITKGTASDLLTQIKAKTEAEPATAKQLYYLRSIGRKPTAGMTKREAMREIARAKR